MWGCRNLKPRFIIGLLVFAAAAVLLNAQADLVEFNYIYGLLGIIFAGYLGFYVANKDGDDDGMPKPIPPMEARKWVQKHLRETRGKRRVYISESQFEGESYHDRVQPVYINGEKHYIYGIVGKPENPVTNEADAGFIRQVFDLTDVTPLQYDNEIPAVMKDEIKVDPLADISNITEAEGNLTNEDLTEESGDTIIEVDNTKQDRRTKSKKDDLREDEFGSIEE